MDLKYYKPMLRFIKNKNKFKKLFDDDLFGNILGYKKYKCAPIYGTLSILFGEINAFNENVEFLKFYSKYTNQKNFSGNIYVTYREKGSMRYKMDVTQVEDAPLQKILDIMALALKNNKRIVEVSFSEFCGIEYNVILTLIKGINNIKSLKTPHNAKDI